MRTCYCYKMFNSSTRNVQFCITKCSNLRAKVVFFRYQQQKSQEITHWAQNYPGGCVPPAPTTKILQGVAR